MAQWSRTNRTLYAKLVYYGPAFGGKTTNLESLHRITDPSGKQELLSVKTVNDRTLFFDLLPFDLGDILGYQVATKLYTVPGQVRYDATRQVVLAGADAVVFVADSSTERREQNMWSLQNLRMNMRSKQLDPKRVPVLFQFNKQDVPEAAAPAEVASWLGIDAAAGYPAVAVRGDGVLETFTAACRAMLEKIIATADERTRRQIDSSRLTEHLDRAFAPHVQRLAETGMTQPESSGPRPDRSIVLNSDNLLENAVEAGVELGQRLATESSRALRLENEAEAFRRLSESLRSLGASFDTERIIDAALEATVDVLEVPVASLIAAGDDGVPRAERCVGAAEDPLLGFVEGRRLARRMAGVSGACVVDELASECDGSGSDGAGPIAGLRAAASVQIDGPRSRQLVVYAAKPDGAFREPDVRFLSTVAGHLAAGLEKARLHDEIRGHRDQLEKTVAERTEELRVALDGLRSLDAMKDRFLSNLSHEMKTPLTAILGSAYAVRDYESKPKERAAMVTAIVEAAQVLERQIDDLLRLVRVEAEEGPLSFEDGSPKQVVEEAIELSGRHAVQVALGDVPAVLRHDRPSLTRALANLIDNAAKFSPAKSVVKVTVGPASVKSQDGSRKGLLFSVLDRGAGVAEADRERIFAPFEQGGDPLTGKPPGIGIGLYEARSIARKHGGELIYRPRDGGGSEFHLIVPLNEVRQETMEMARA